MGGGSTIWPVWESGRDRVSGGKVTSVKQMTPLNITGLRCDGCGQTAPPEHIARRLRRLEWATRYRPMHIQTLLLGAVGPCEDSEFLYSPGGEFRGEAGQLLRAIGIDVEGKTAAAVHEEFQANGFFLAHILECPVEDGLSSMNCGESALERRSKTPATDTTELLREHLPAVVSRIRRSLKPKRVILVTELLESVVEDIVSLNLGCPVLLSDGKPFALDEKASSAQVSKFRELLAGARNS